MRPILTPARFILDTLREKYHMSENEPDVGIFIRAACNQHERGGSDEAKGRYNLFVQGGQKTLPWFVIDDFREKTGQKSLV